MTSTLSTMWTCHWSARRIHRYLDADPAAPLSAAEIRRLQAHLAVCARCAAAVEDFRGIRGALQAWTRHRTPDPARITRLREQTRHWITEDAQ